MPKVTELPSASSVTGLELIPGVQAGTTRKIKVEDLLSPLGPRPYGNIYAHVDAANRNAMMTGAYPFDDAFDSLVNQGMSTVTMAGSMGVIPKGVFLSTRPHEFFKKSVRLDFLGGWSADMVNIGTNREGSVIMYDGLAGDHPITFRACWGVEVNGLKIAVQPGAAIPASLLRITQVPDDGVTCNFLTFRRICLGQLSSFDTGHVAGEFDVGLLVDGINGNDSIYYEMIVVFGPATDGVRITNSQAVAQTFDGLYVYAAGRDALRTNASIKVESFGANSCQNGVYVVNGTKVLVGNSYCEACPRHFTVESNSTLEFKQGYYDLGVAHADGIIGDTPGLSDTTVRYEDFAFTGTPPAGITPKIRLNPGTTCRRYLYLSNVEGLVEANIDAAISTDTPDDLRVIEGYKPSTGQRFRNVLQGGGGFAMVPSVCGLPNIDFNRWDNN